MITHSLIELIGKTPLLELTPGLEEGHARLLAKLEMCNPGGSIKDRPALAMVEAAEREGHLRPGMTIVEPTAGNTGIGLALIGNLKGYRTVFFVPDRMSREKIMMMKLYGAEVFLVPKELGMVACIERARAYCEEHGDCFSPQQFENPANPWQAETRLGPEIGEQLGFVPDGLAIGAGTGGTFTGLARWLKKHNPEGRCYLVEPEGSILGGGPKGTYQVEGIGNSFFPETLDMSIVDSVVTVADIDSFAACGFIAKQYGLVLGGSCGANFVAAKKLAAELGPGKTVVTVFPDNMERYFSKEWTSVLAGMKP